MTVWVRKRNSLVAVLLVIIFLLGLGTLRLRHNFSTPKSVRPTVILGSKLFYVDTAATPVARERGLSGRKSLAESEGMLFVSSNPEKACYWMKDMMFNIDILWFDKSRTLIYQKQNATPASYPEVFCPPTETQYVFEVQQGTSEQLHLKLGDKLILGTGAKQ